MSKRKVIITGGSRGIGAECVRAFARLGDAVVFIYNKSDERAEKLSQETGAHAIKADISEPAAAVSAVKEAILYLGGADILVNNAGVSSAGLLTDVMPQGF